MDPENNTPQQGNQPAPASQQAPSAKLPQAPSAELPQTPSAELPQTPSAELPQTPPPPPLAPEYRPRGKIARLPHAQREKLNQMLDDGTPYPELVTYFAGIGVPLNTANISRWYKSGYQYWSKGQLWLEQSRSRFDFATDVIKESDGPTVHHANLHVAATQIIDDLLEQGPKLLQNRPEEYVSMVNSITRLSREALNYQKYREACELAKAQVAKLKDPNRKLSEAEILAIVNRLDEILGFK